MGNFLFREVSSLTTHILATDTDIIIQISAVFVKVTGAKRRKNKEICIAVPLNPVLCVEQVCSTQSCAVIFTVDKRHERSCRKCQKEARTSTREKTGVGKVDTLNVVHYTEGYSTAMSMGNAIITFV